MEVKLMNEQMDSMLRKEMNYLQRLKLDPRFQYILRLQMFHTVMKYVLDLKKGAGVPDNFVETDLYRALDAEMKMYVMRVI